MELNIVVFIPVIILIIAAIYMSFIFPKKVEKEEKENKK